jgi:holliday junction DNA helicase RuvB
VSMSLGGADQEERIAENALRPTKLEDFVGQPKIRAQLDVVLQAAANASRVPDHILLAGPPGLGKTTLAMIVANESGRALRLTSGPAIQSSADLASMLSALQPGDVLFIDEIHRMARSAEEMLYLAMEDFRVDVMVGKGPGAASISLDIAPFTLVGATTRSGMLPTPLRDRFGFTAFLEFYSDEELAMVISRSAQLIDLSVTEDALEQLSQRSRGTPRIANRLLRRVRDFASVKNQAVVDLELATETLELFEIDARGLDRIDRALLALLANQFGGRPTGLKTLAVAIGEEPDTLESVIEPYLIRLGFINRSPRGREITESGLAHLRSCGS